MSPTHELHPCLTGYCAHMDNTVCSAYGERAREYTDALGAMDAVAAEDQALVTDWASTLNGHVIDAGCGPGHWTHYLHRFGLDIAGVDLVPEFVAEASTRFPEVSYELGDLRNLPSKDGSLGGILSWYSIIHAQPEEVPIILTEFFRVLSPGGSLLLGFFRGNNTEPFDHAVTTAYYWSIEAMSSSLEGTGFRVQETHARQDPGARPHAAIWALKP